MAKKVLGKGLGALLTEDEPVFSNQNTEIPPPETEAAGERLIDISLLKPNPYQPRGEFDAEALQELAESIREHGIIQPVLAEQLDDGSYYIIAGERRTRAARLAGLTRIPVLLKKYSDERKLEIALIENIQREDLNPAEEARAYKKLMEMGNLTQEEAAARVGKNRSTVANALRLLKLPEDMLNAVTSGQITAGHARALLSVENSADQRVLFGRIVGSGMSVREAERNAAELNNGSRAAAATKKSAPAQPRKDPQL
ncbi:MAG: ParB/RepB/Spo0J family partition protein, partial [Spirochaetaceae bacterium]|nr:ParB/RepB/Spo0J family partition protein [Spirochaetaceae bacterium]